MRNKFKILLVLFTAVTLLLGFTETANMVTGGWYQQFLPSIGSEQINDIVFLDSLIGYAVASRNVNSDTASILKTTNGGDSWQVIFTQTPKRFNRIQFVNSSTGFICGGSGGGTPQLYKTTDAGQSWSLISSFGCALWKDMYVLDENTIWLVDDNSLCGGVFYTSNGGASWDHQFSGGNQNPNKIYMFNARIGFMGNNSGTPNIYKTTNSGVNWSVNVSGKYFRDMHFIDSLTGWYAYGNDMYKTTNGGINWVTQILPTGGNLVITGIYEFSVLNKDTLIGIGGVIAFNTQTRGIIYRTIDGGNNWLYQTPDTAIHIFQYQHIKFVDNLNGWAYSLSQGGIHTKSGGDPIWLTGLKQISGNIPKEFKLYQNFPNPFNPTTNIGFRIANFGFVKIEVYNILGQRIATLVNQALKPGSYKVDFPGNNSSSGVYFYSLYMDEKLIDTKKMILLK